MSAHLPQAIPAIGSQLAGGTVLGHHVLKGQLYALIVPPKAEREIAPTRWNKSLAMVAGATSYFDGRTNTHAMAEAGSGIAKHALSRVIGGHADWYIPSRVEALIIRGNVDALEAFERGWYWTSTQDRDVSDWAWYQDFSDWANQNHDHKSYEYRAFLVRRVPIRYFEVESR